MVKETFVDVVPSYEVPADVNVATGHIDFAGDVTVRRNVEESLKVRAGGSVIIGGMVFRKARVEAGGSVRVRGVVGGSISAGGNTAVYGPLIEGLGRLAPLVQKAAENLRRVEEASRADGKGFPDRRRLQSTAGASFRRSAKGGSVDRSLFGPAQR